MAKKPARRLSPVRARMRDRLDRMIDLRRALESELVSLARAEEELRMQLYGPAWGASTVKVSRKRRRR